MHSHRCIPHDASHTDAFDTYRRKTLSLVKGLIKGAVVAKLVQVASRELSKPENQRRIKEGLSKLTKPARSR